MVYEYDVGTLLYYYHTTHDTFLEARYMQFGVLMLAGFFWEQ